MCQRLHEEYVTEISYVCSFIPKYNQMLSETCNAEKPAMNDVPENIEIHTTIEEFYGNAMEN